LEVQVLSARFRAGPQRRHRVAEECFYLYDEVNTLMTSSCTLSFKCYAFINIISFEAYSVSNL
jgi:hypothetical protein